MPLSDYYFNKLIFMRVPMTAVWLITQRNQLLNVLIRFMSKAVPKLVNEIYSLTMNDGFITAA